MKLCDTFQKFIRYLKNFLTSKKIFNPTKFFFSLRFFLNSCGNLQVKTQRTGLLPLLSLTYVLLLAHSAGHSYGKNIKLHEMKNEKNYMGFLQAQ